MKRRNNEAITFKHKSAICILKAIRNKLMFLVDETNLFVLVKSNHEVLYKLCIKALYGNLTRGTPLTQRSLIVYSLNVDGDKIFRYRNHGAQKILYRILNMV